MSQLPVKWVIIVKTSDKVASGIDSSIFIKFHGDKGSARPIELGDRGKKKLANVRSPFSQACTSHFSVARNDIGNVTEIDVWHNADRAWVCESIEIQKGNDSWVFKPRDPIPSQSQLAAANKKGQKTRLAGEYAQVSNGANRFHAAARSGDVDALQKMINDNEFDVDCVDKLGRTAAHYAVLYGQLDALELLIEFQADIGKKDFSGKHCLHHACVNHVNNIDIINILLKQAPHKKADYLPEIGVEEEKDEDATEEEMFIRSRDSFGKNSMHYAATYGFVPVIQLLESKCPISIRDKDLSGQTPLHCAALQGETKAALTLVDLGAIIDAQDREGKTFLHHAATAGHAELIATVLEHEFPASTRKQLHALLNFPDINGRTPLLCAAASGQLDALKVTYRLGSDIYQTDRDKSNALVLAARNGDDKLLAYCAQKLEVNSANEFGYTPLHVAVEGNNPEAVRWLIRFSADLDAQLATGETPLKLAEERGYDEIKRSLENAASVSASKVVDASKGDGSGSDASKFKNGVPVSAPIDKLSDMPLMPVPPKPPTPPPPPNPDAALIQENQDLTYKIEHLQQALIEKNKIIQEYRNQFGQLQVDLVASRQSDGEQPKVLAKRSCF